MTAPTHIAFAMACGLLSGSPAFAIKLLAGGALLPDIDHPQSAIGRIFFFISYPLNRTFGHRRHVHSLVVWIPFTIAGFFFYKPIAEILKLNEPLIILLSFSFGLATVYYEYLLSIFQSAVCNKFP